MEKEEQPQDHSAIFSGTVRISTWVSQVWVWHFNHDTALDLTWPWHPDTVYGCQLPKRGFEISGNDNWSPVYRGQWRKWLLWKVYSQYLTPLRSLPYLNAFISKLFPHISRNLLVHNKVALGSGNITHLSPIKPLNTYLTKQLQLH